MSSTHHQPVVMAYAQALLELADQGQQAEALGGEMAGLRAVLDQNPNFVLFLADPVVPAAQRDKVITDVFAGKVSPLLLNFLRLANAKNRLNYLREIALAYDDLLQRKLGRIEVDLTVAHRLSDADLEQVRQKISQALKKDARIHQHVDESIIGGMMLQVEDRLIDASVKSQLQTMKQRLLSGAPA